MPRSSRRKYLKVRRRRECVLKVIELIDHITHLEGVILEYADALTELELRRLRCGLDQAWMNVIDYRPKLVN